MVTATLTGLGTAVPTQISQEELWEEFFADRYRRSEVGRRIWRHAGINGRHGVVDPRIEDISGWGTEARMRRFVDEGLRLGTKAVSACLDDARLTAGDVDQLTVISCTGYATPGLDVLVARDLGMRADVQRLQIGHMGCYAAVPGLATAANAAAARGQTVLLLCLELSSLHLQQPTDNVDQIIAHALFADAAAAAAVVPDHHGQPGLEVLDVVVRTDTDHAALMTWDVTDRGFRMGLSPQVPEALRRHAAHVVRELLARHDLDLGRVDAWAIHPGGPRIIEVVAECLGLGDEQVAESRRVLAENGNCSSATLLLVLDHIVRRRELPSGSHIVTLAFGPGLTLYAALLRQR